MQFLKFVFLLVVPGVLFVAALYLQLRVAIVDSWQPLLDLFPYLTVGAGLFLGWRFNRTRVLWIIALLLLVERSLVLTASSNREYLLQVAQILGPLNLVLFSWWSERGLFTRHGLLRLVILVVQAGVVFLLSRPLAGEAVTWLNRPLMNSAWLDQSPYPQVAMLVMACCAVALLVRFSKKPEVLEGSFCWVLLAAVIGFWRPDDFDFWVGIAAFLLTIAIIESSFRMAFNDELTGLPGRRAMNEFLLKSGSRFTFAMVDVDHFKKVNDHHGHEVGDQVLRMVATFLRRITGGGRAYRYGGEEFAVIFPNKDLERSLPHLETLRETIARSEFVVRGRKRPNRKPEDPVRKASGAARFHITVSVGAASRDDRNTTSEQLIKAADQALYKAKKAGRNRVCT